MSLILAVAVAIGRMVLVVGTVALGLLPVSQYDVFSHEKSEEILVVEDAGMRILSTW